VAKELVQVAGALESKALAGLQVAQAGGHSILIAARTWLVVSPSVVFNSWSRRSAPSASAH
jgi:hypothetical protein